MSNIAIEHNESSLHEVFPFSSREIEPLMQIAQSAAAGSTNSLRDFLGIYSDIRVNCLSFLPLPILMERVQLYYQNHLGFHLRFSGEIHGEIFSLIHEEHALKFIERASGQKSNPRRQPETRRFNRPELAMLVEWVNIISNPFRQTLTEKTLFNWWITQPLPVTEVTHSITYAAKIFNLDHYAIHLEYQIPLLGLRTQFFILPAVNVLPRILSRLGQSESPGGWTPPVGWALGKH